MEEILPVCVYFFESHLSFAGISQNKKLVALAATDGYVLFIDVNQRRPLNRTALHLKVFDYSDLLPFDDFFTDEVFGRRLLHTRGLFLMDTIPRSIIRPNAETIPKLVLHSSGNIVAAITQSVCWLNQRFYDSCSKWYCFWNALLDHLLGECIVL